MKPVIFVVGSSNTDMVITTAHLPAPGETILGGKFFMNPGGKGANQAVAAARLGGNVTFICKIGNDVFGQQALKHFNEESINTSYLCADAEKPSGVALITVDEEGENSIVVASGSNATLSPQDFLPAQQELETAALVLLQLEIPLHTVEYVAELAASKGVKVILNPAPACTLPMELLKNIALITPNEIEAELLSGVPVTGIESAKIAAQKLGEKGVKTVIITLGKKGALVYDNGEFTHVPSRKVIAVDTTAAGDIFNGALVVALSEGKGVIEATEFACTAAAISVTRPGAQSSAPYRKETDTFCG